jgi:2-iminobutanoate/2-iminopropanoate deaminase
MGKTTLALVLMMPFLAVIAQAQADSGQPKGTAVAPKSAPVAPSSARFVAYHAGPWEEKIGYAQAIRAGNMLYVSGTVGTDAKGQPEDLDSQMKKAYAAIDKTLAHYGTDFSHIVMERIYTTDIDALIRSQETRKQVYGEHAPAATWVEVKRLYSSGDKLEIEVQAVLE